METECYGIRYTDIQDIKKRTCGMLENDYMTSDAKYWGVQKDYKTLGTQLSDRALVLHVSSLMFYPWHPPSQQKVSKDFDQSSAVG